MGGLILERDEDVPEQLRWIKNLEEARRPPLNSLVNICARYVSSNLDKTLLDGGALLDEDSDFSDDEMSVEWESAKPKEDVFLPLVLSQTIFNMIPCGRRGVKHSDVLAAFASSLKPNPLPLTSLDLCGSADLNDTVLEKYLKASSSTLVSLNISKCRNLSYHSLGIINKYGTELKSLAVGTSAQIFSVRDPFWDGGALKDGSVLYGPKKLERLVIHNVVKGSEPFNKFYRGVLFKYNECLSCLDLSGCYLRDFDFLASLCALRSLLLYNVQLQHELGSFFSVVERLSKRITHLDISLPGSKAVTWGTFENPDNLLGGVVRALDNLTSLDISGTNLAGSGVAQLTNFARGAGELCCDIPGLNSRSKRPLEYLGLYGAAHDASHRHFIPAKLIGGDRDEWQIINAARAFIDRHEVLEKILNDLFHLFRTEPGRNERNVKECLRLILLAMERHPGEKHIQISGSASLFYIVKNNRSYEPVTGLKRRILLAIVGAMQVHSGDPTMMRNGCLTICHFTIPQDVMFLYEQLVKILLSTLGSSLVPGNNEDFNERIAIYLLNSLACQVEGEQKRLVGDLGAIEKMLDLIRGRLNRGDCDDVMEIAWSTMWNVTDETPENCNKFLQYDGMALFLQCLQSFPNQPELLRNMMGLLGNVAEVAELRPHLMTGPFISVFYELLNSKQDNIEVSYNAAGVLAHILSDGERAWEGVDSPTRPHVCQRMRANIKEWNIDSPRNINYRSFKPILRLLLVRHTLECRLWAAWALANLTNVYPEKYVELLKDEGGLDFLQPEANGGGTLSSSPDADDLARYASIAVDNVNKYNPNPESPESALEAPVQ